METIGCEWCGERFARKSERGRPPRFCSASHREQASRARRARELGVAVAAGYGSSLEQLSAAIAQSPGMAGFQDQVNSWAKVAMAPATKATAHQAELMRKAVSSSPGMLAMLDGLSRATALQGAQLKAFTDVTTAPAMQATAHQAELMRKAVSSSPGMLAMLDGVSRATALQGAQLKALADVAMGPAAKAMAEQASTLRVALSAFEGPLTEVARGVSVSPGILAMQAEVLKSNALPDKQLRALADVAMGPAMKVLAEHAEMLRKTTLAGPGAVISDTAKAASGWTAEMERQAGTVRDVLSNGHGDGFVRYVEDVASMLRSSEVDELVTEFQARRTLGEADGDPIAVLVLCGFLAIAATIRVVGAPESAESVATAAYLTMSLVGHLDRGDGGHGFLLLLGIAFAVASLRRPP